MSIGSVGSNAFVAVPQASFERIGELQLPPTFKRPALAPAARPDTRLQPRQVAISFLRSASMKRLMDDAAGSDGDQRALMRSVEAHIRQGGRLIDLVDGSDALQATRLYVMTSVLATERSNTDAEFSKRLHVELAALLASNEAEISAAINSSAAFDSMTPADGDRRWLRAGYVAVVSTQGSVNELLESLLVRFGPQRFFKGAAVLIAGLNDDLSSASPSIRPSKLHLMLLASIVAMRRLMSFVNATSAFIEAIDPDREQEHQDGNQERHDANSDGEAQDVAKPADRARSGISERDAATVKTFLQLISGQSSIKVVKDHIEQNFSHNLPAAQQRRIFKSFIDFIQDTPLSIWRERSHKDKLVTALRRQLLLELFDLPQDGLT